MRLIYGELNTDSRHGKHGQSASIRFGDILHTPISWRKKKKTSKQTLKVRGTGEWRTCHLIPLRLYYIKQTDKQGVDTSFLSFKKFVFLSHSVSSISGDILDDMD